MHYLSLNGAWTVAQIDSQDTFPAQVPGTIHTDLLAAGRIEDPFYRDREDTLQWIGETGWVYRRQFIVTEDLLRHDCLCLRCLGLDTLATISINGVQVASTDNMFRTWEFDVKPCLHVGENEIVILLSPVPEYIRERQLRREVPAWLVSRAMKGQSWVRKEPCNFGWDWGPTLITCGIWRSLELLAFDTARLIDMQVLQDHSVPGKVTLRVQSMVEQVHSTTMQAIITVEYNGQTVAGVNTQVVDNCATAEVLVPNAQLWWPNGLGAQPLYTVHCMLTDGKGFTLDTLSRRIGLRTLHLQRIEDAVGESFQFRVNGVPFFAKGANWIPADTFATRVTHAQYADLLQSAVDANMNMLRSWGGGIYEDDIFFDLCDELGLCVWQDFIFACSTYPTFDEEFMRNFKTEAEDNVRRMRHHPCIALWCGNNELEMGLIGEQWDDRHMSWHDYSLLFDELLPAVITALDPERDYWPCSPHTPNGPREDFNNPACGDAHLWDVWHGKKPFEYYRTCAHRFISEFGFQSFPEPSTVTGFTLPEDRNITSYVMEHHQRSWIGNGTILTYMLDWFQLPSTFDMTLWLSQILQGVGMQYGVEHWRRNMPTTMGTLYWQLNDCWPVASWASIDYHGRWKASHYLAKRFYAPVLISGVEDIEHGTVAVHVTSDLREQADGTIVWKITDTAGNILAEDSRELSIPALQDSLVTTIDAKELLAKHGKRNLLVWMEAWRDGVCVSGNICTFIRPKHLTLGDPKLAFEILPSGDTELQVTITAKSPALWVWLTAGDIVLRCSDNFLHLQANVPQVLRITVPAGTPCADVASKLRAYSLFDTYQAK